MENTAVKKGITAQSQEEKIIVYCEVDLNQKKLENVSYELMFCYAF